MLSFLVVNLLYLFVLGAAHFAFASPLSDPYLSSQSEKSDGISIGFFASLERISRLVDVAYCVGTTGIWPPFSCVSRCRDFPSLELVTTWNTGLLLSDSCGYIAVDHGTPSTMVESLPTTHERKEPVGKTSPAIIIAFRGTYSITNTVIDLSTVPQKYVPYPPAHDEHGPPPEEPELIARQTVLPVLKRLHEQYPTYPIHVIGHSLGGAVGALAALEMKVNLAWNQIIVTSFGEPRVGNKGFVKYLDAAFDLQDDGNMPEQRAYRRITHIDDPVPLLPLSEWGYRSHAGEFFISKHQLSPKPSDIWPCVGDHDLNCIAGSDGEENEFVRTEIPHKPLSSDVDVSSVKLGHLLGRFKPWELFFAHRDYFWRLGLCIPGGDPIDWGRNRYPPVTMIDEL